MEANQSNYIIEGYWELLSNLDAGTKLALITRLAQSLQSDLTNTENLFPINQMGQNTNTNSTTAGTTNRPANNNDTETFWWDALED